MSQQELKKFTMNMEDHVYEFLREKAFKEKTSIKEIIDASLAKSGNYPKKPKSKKK